MSPEERKAHNEAVFREANEEIRRVQKDLELSDGPVPFLCECDEETCRTVVRVSADAYEAIRSHGTRFLVAAGHPTEGRVVAQHDGYFVSQKEGRAAEIAEARDPRGEN
jgi:hypothetical protein